NARQRALNGFRDGSVRILVATDIAARGIDVPGISHVVNFDLPDQPESYVHRIGRTGRNGASGEAVTLCDPGETDKLKAVEKVIRMRLPVTADHTSEPDPARPVPANNAGERRNAPKPSRGGENRKPKRPAAKPQQQAEQRQNEGDKPVRRRRRNRNRRPGARAA
ncbi:MAG: helicase-related protein, partial [Nitratireductor sp.]